MDVQSFLWMWGRKLDTDIFSRSIPLPDAKFPIANPLSWLLS